MDNTKTPPKTSITQRLRTYLGWSVGVTTVIQLVWLNRVSRVPTFPLTTKEVYSIVHGKIEMLFIIQPDFQEDGFMLKSNQESNETLLYNLTTLK